VLFQRDPKSLVELAPSVLTGFDLDPSWRLAMRLQLRRLGMSHVTVFPDLDALARQLAEFGG
jgi:hypothetical protein